MPLINATNIDGDFGESRLVVKSRIVTQTTAPRADIEYIEKHVIMNREYSINHRQEIRNYAREFDWPEIFDKFYFPSIKEVIDEKLS